MPRIVAIVAVSAVSTSDPRNSASRAIAESPRPPPATTSPTTGARTKRRKRDAMSATTTAIAARETALGCRAAAGAVVSRTLASNSTCELGRRSGTDDDRTIEHVDVRGAELLHHGRRHQEIQEPA